MCFKSVFFLIIIIIIIIITTIIIIIIITIIICKLSALGRKIFSHDNSKFLHFCS